MNHLSGLFLFFLLTSCASVQTFVNNPDVNYNRHNIVVTQTLTGRSLTMGSYTLEYEKGIYQEKEISRSDDGTVAEVTQGGEYSFKKDNGRIYDLKIFETGVVTKTKTNSAGMTKKILQISKDNRFEAEYQTVNEMGKTEFLRVDQNGHPIVVAKYYKLNDNSDPNPLLALHTGFLITVDGQEAGILAFYPRLTYFEKKTPAVLLPDEVVMLTLASYELDKIRIVGK